MSLYKYESYEEARENFSWKEKWSIFDGNKQEFNIAYECLDRFDQTKTGVNIQLSSGERQTYTRDKLSRYSAMFAHALEEKGIEKGEKVAIMLEPNIDFFISLFGVWKRGAVAVPMHMLFQRKTIDYRLKDCNPELIVTTEHKLKEDMPRDIPCEVITDNSLRSFIKSHDSKYTHSTSADDPAIVMYTSGTTGKPKGYEMPHKLFVNYAPVGVFSHGIQSEDIVFCPTKPAFMMGLLNGVTVPLYLGATAGTYVGKFDAGTVIEGLAQSQVTALISVATGLRKLANSGYLSQYDLSINKIASGGEMLDKDTIRTFKEDVGIIVTNGYGTSEHGTIISNYALFDNWRTKVGSLGKPFPGVETSILDESGDELEPNKIGEIAYRISAEDNWIRTGDAGKYDEDGYYWHEGRMDDVIITSGYRIGPHEVEDALMEHPEVNEAAAVASPDEERGNIVKAFIMIDSEESPDLKSDIKEYVKNNLSKYAYPREIEFVEQFPRTSNSKIKRNELSEKESRGN